MVILMKKENLQNEYIMNFLFHIVILAYRFLYLMLILSLDMLKL